MRSYGFSRYKNRFGRRENRFFRQGVTPEIGLTGKIKVSGIVAWQELWFPTQKDYLVIFRHGLHRLQ